MALRLLQFSAQEEHHEKLIEHLEQLDINPLAQWSDGQGAHIIQCIVQAEQLESVVDELDELNDEDSGMCAIILNIEASLPSPKKKEDDEDDEGITIGRISRDELQRKIEDSLSFDVPTTAMIVLSTIVAVVGLVRGDTAVIVGAMVIAPLLSPNVALCFATTLGDFSLIRRALSLGALYLIIALVLSAIIGATFPLSLTSDAITARTQVSLPDVALAMAAGSAGVFAFTRGLSEAVIGVMVAAALLPPLTVVGLELGQLNFELAIGAAGLVSVNVICINLAGVATFLAQGVGPRVWWEAKRAKRATIIAISIWTLLLAGLIALMMFYN